MQSAERAAHAVALRLPPAALAGPAIGQFEVRSLESAPGDMAFQSQNAHQFGQPARCPVEGEDERLYDDNSVTRQRHALEREFGITPHLKSRVGEAYGKERIEDPADPDPIGRYDGLWLSEVGAELILFLGPIKANDDRGVAAEYERPQGGDEASTLLLDSIV